MWTLHSLLNAGVLSDMLRYMQHSMLGLSINIIVGGKKPSFIQCGLKQTRVAQCF